MCICGKWDPERLRWLPPSFRVNQHQNLDCDSGLSDFQSNVDSSIVNKYIWVLRACLAPKKYCLSPMAPHSSTLAWEMPWTEEPGGLQSMGPLGVGHDWATSLSLFTFMHWRRKWQPAPVFLPGEPQGRGSLVGCRLGVTQSRTRLTRLSSSSTKYSLLLLFCCCLQYDHHYSQRTDAESRLRLNLSEISCQLLVLASCVSALIENNSRSYLMGSWKKVLFF